MAKSTDAALPTIAMTPAQRDIEMRLDECLDEMLRSGMDKADLAEMVGDFIRSWEQW